jgi:iron complex outermembrane receptor protein
MSSARRSNPCRHRLSHAVRLSLLLSLPTLALPALAQEQQASEPEQATTLDTVEVTGTRIRRADLETQVPVQVLTREDIDRTGFTSVAEVVQNLTASGAALNTKFNSSGNFGFPPDGGGVGAGAATVDLRHLGPKRVLVLVDGIRWVNESSASGVGSSRCSRTVHRRSTDRMRSPAWSTSSPAAMSRAATCSCTTATTTRRAERPGVPT